MAPLLGRLFASEQTRGLSGDSASAVALDDANPYYNYRLRRHKADGDLVVDPNLLWFTSPYVKRRTGLGTHVAAEKADGTATYTDVLIILSEEDWSRTTSISGQPWTTVASRGLSQEFDNFCRREGLARPYAHRPIGFRFLVDGSPEMHGKTLGLQRGEFITGLLPNLYTGPVRGSYPVIAVHMNLPGVWDGYQEVGKLFNDQLLFTIGNHWLDDFQHPALAEAAVYRLQQAPDGSFVHIINPDLQDRYQVTSTQQGGASVLTLATRAGVPLAYLVLALIDPPSQVTPEPPPRRPEISLGPSALPTPSVPPPMLLDDSLLARKRPDPRLGKKTIIPDAPVERIFTLQERGALLQKVHFGAFMDGYNVYLGLGGELGTAVEQKAATFQVRKKSVALVAHVDGVSISGIHCPIDLEMALDGDLVIEFGNQKYEYRDLRRVIEVDGWPYVGEIRRPASSTYMAFGDDYLVGRSRECRVALPDEVRNDNIMWKASVGDGATIRARSGEIRKSNFYTDSIMVASEHAKFELAGEAAKVACVARHCYVFVRREGTILPLYPASSESEPKEMPLLPGDDVLIGNITFNVSFNTMGDLMVSAPAAPRFNQGGTPPPARPRAELPPELPATDTLAGLPFGVAFDPMLDDKPKLPGLATGPGEPDTATQPIDLIPREPERPAAGPAVEISGWDDDDAWDEPTGRVSWPVAHGGSPTNSVPTPFPELEDAPAPVPGLPATFQDVMPPLPNDSVPPTPSLEPGPPGSQPTRGDMLPSPMSLQPAPVWDSIPPLPNLDRTADEHPTLTSADDVPSQSSLDDAVPPFTSDEEEPPPLPQDRGNEPPPPPLSPAPSLDGPFVEPSYTSSPESAPPLSSAQWGSNAGSWEPPPQTAATPLMAVTTPMTPGWVDEDPPPPPPPEEPATELDSGPIALSPVARSVLPVSRQVVYTSDSDAQFELGRPMHLVLAGWMVNGDAVCGNHTGADLILPENRILPDQTFEAVDYFKISVRGRRGSLEILAPRELLVDQDDPSKPVYDEIESRVIDIIRRDERGDEDFGIRLTVREDRRLPDPRARFVAIDAVDPLTAALVTKGLPRATPRVLKLGGITATFLYDQGVVRVSDYLADYRRPDGTFAKFFEQRGEGRFKTAPEDGSPFELRHGDQIVIGGAIYLLREE